MGAQMLHQCERLMQAHARFERAHPRGLDQWAIGHRVGKRHADFNQIGAGGSHAFE